MTVDFIQLVVKLTNLR